MFTVKTCQIVDYHGLCKGKARGDLQSRDCYGPYALPVPDAQPTLLKQ